MLAYSLVISDNKITYSSCYERMRFVLMALAVKRTDLSSSFSFKENSVLDFFAKL